MAACWDACPVPPSASGSVALSPPAVPVVFWFRVGTSPAAIVPHEGSFAADPVPVEVRNCFVADVGPASLAAFPPEPPSIMSPSVVIGFVATLPHADPSPDPDAIGTCPGDGVPDGRGRYAE